MLAVLTAVVLAAMVVVGTQATAEPVNGTVPSIAGLVQNHERITARPGRWTGTGAIAYAYQWQTCDESGETCEDVIGVRERTLLLNDDLVGERVRVRVTATDSGGPTVAYSAATAPVGVAAPQAESPPLAMGVAQVGRTLEATGAVFTGGEPFRFAYQWRHCDSLGESCADVESATAATYTLTEADLGATLRVVQSAENDSGRAQATSEPTAVVGSATVVNVEAPIVVVEESAAGERLVADPGSWSGAGPLTYAYRWQRCDASGTTCAAIPGAADETYALTDGDVGYALRLMVVASGPSGSASAVSAPTSAYAAGAPANVADPAFTGGAVADSSLHADEGSWSGTQPLEFHFQWRRCDAEGSRCADVRDATRRAYELEAADVGATLRLVVTATNATSSANETSAASAVVLAATPLVAEVEPNVAGDPYVGETLTADPGEWEGAGMVSHSYQWQRCDRFGEECEEIEGASVDTYLLSTEDAGSVVRVAVTASDAATEQTLLAYASGPIMTADGPTSTTAPTISGTAAEGETLTATTGSWEGRGGISYAYQWQSCIAGTCVDVADATGSTYELTDEDVFHTIRVAVTARDDDGETTAVSSVSGTVVAGRLANWHLPTIGGDALRGEALSADPGLWSQSASYAYAWQRCDARGEACRAIEGATASTYTLVEADSRATIRVVVTASNVGGRAEATSEATGVVDDVAPVNSVAPALSGTATQGQTLSATEGTWSGADTVALRWQRCDAEGEECDDLPGQTGTRYVLTRGDVGSTLRVVATAANAAGETEERSAESAVVAAAALENTARPRIDGDPEEGVTFTADPGSWTGDGSISYAYRWRYCDAQGERCEDIEGATGTTYALTEEDVGWTYRLVVTASNAWGSRSAVSTLTPVVQQALPVNDVAPELAGEAVAGGTLSALDGEWSGSPGEASYQWRRCDTEGAACRDIDGATDDELELTDGDVGDTFRAVVSITNTRGTGRATTDASAVVRAAPPVNVEAPTLDWPEARTARADPGEWSGTPPIDHTYAWERCDEAELEECSPIEGATSATYELTEADVGAWVRVAVTAENDGGRAVERSAADGPIPPPPSTPVSLEDPVVYGYASPGRELWAYAGDWESDEAVGFAYQWQRCTTGEAPVCSDIEGATQETYVPDESDLGATLRVQVTATNTAGSARETSALTVVVADAAPRADGGAYVGNWPRTREASTAGTGEWSGSGPLRFTFQWRRCDAEGAACRDIEGATEQDHVPDEADLGSTLRVVVTATNGLGFDQSTTEATEVVVEGPALNTSRPAIVGEAFVGETLTADEGGWTPTPSRFSYQWRRCDAGGDACITVAEGARATSYRLVAADYGHRIRLIVWSYLNEASRVVEADLSAVVDTHAPLSLEAPAVTGTPAPGELLTAEPGRWDGDATIGYTYEWESCNTALSSCFALTSTSASPNYRVRALDTGRRLRAIVTATNGAGTDDARSAATEIVSEAADDYLPEIAVSGELIVGSTLFASPTESVPGLQLAYKWQRCDAEGESCVDVEFGFSYALAAADEGATMRAVASDFYDFWAPEAPVSSSPATAVVRPAVLPENVEAPTLDGEAEPGVTLTSDLGEWSGSDPVEYEAEFLRCDAEGGNCAEIEGAQNWQNVYRVTLDDVGATLRLRVTATNAAGSVSVDSAPTEVVPAPPPLTNVFAPWIDEWSWLWFGEEVDWEPGTWTGAPTVTATWQRCDQLAEDPDASCTDIPGAEGDYTPQAADVGYQLRIRETAVSGEERVTVHSERTTSYVGGELFLNFFDPPTYTGRPAAGETIVVDSHITATPDTLPTTYTYTFQRYDEAFEVVVLQEGEDAEYTLRDEDAGWNVWVDVDATMYRDDRALAIDTESGDLSLGTIDPRPTNDVLPQIEGDTALGGLLSVGPGRWHGGGGALAYAYAWQRCDAEGEECRAIDGADEATYTATEADLGVTLRVAVTAQAGDGEGRATSAATAVVAAATPLASAEPPEIAGTLAELETLSAGRGDWSGSTPTGFAYQWQRCATDDVDTCVDAEGANEADYALTAEDVGSRMAVVVTATNGAGEALAISALTDEVEAAPTPTGPQPAVALIGRAVPGAIASGEAGEWEHVDARDLVYQWQRCDAEGEGCSDIEGADERLHTLVEDDIDARLRLVVSAENTSGSASRTSEELPLVQEAGDSAAEKMVYASGDLLYVADLDGSDAEPIAECGEVDPWRISNCDFAHPRISPNGLAITVAAVDDEEAWVVVMNHDGTGKRVVAEHGTEPSWAPLGLDIVYTRHDEEEPQRTRLYVVRADALDPSGGTPLIDGGEGDQAAGVWSPDGMTIAYLGRDEGEAPWQLRVVGEMGGAEPRVVPLETPITDPAEPAFTRDGSRIVFSARPPSNPSQMPRETVRLYEVSPDGEGLTSFATPTDEHFERPAIAPDDSITIVRQRYFWNDTGFGGYWTSEVPTTWRMRADGSNLRPFPVAGGASVDLSYGPGPIATAALDQVICPTNAPGDPIQRIGAAGEPNVLVRGWFRGSCRTQLAYRLKLCIEMIGGSDNDWHQQKCNNRQAQIRNAWDFIDQRIDLLCRPGTRWYRLIAEVSWGSRLPKSIPILGDDHFEVKRSARYKINCNEAGAWRFHAKRRMDFIEVGQARRIDPGAVLGRELRTSDRYGDEPDAGLPDNGTNGWAAHHIISKGHTRTESSESQRVGWVCGLKPNSAINGLWLRGPNLKKGTDAYGELDLFDRLRPYHPRVHTRAYFQYLRRRLAQFATRDNRCTNKVLMKRVLRELYVRLRFDVLPYRGASHKPGEGE